MHESLYDFCRRTGQSGLLDQWDTERNGAGTPRTVSYGSQRKMWWLCEKGHSWQASVNSRLSGSGCPVCGGSLGGARRAGTSRRCGKPLGLVIQTLRRERPDHFS